MATVVLITGGVGFVGRAIVQAIRAEHPEWVTTVFDKVELGEYELEPSISYTCGDITNADEVDHVVSAIRPTAIIHTAGIVPPLAGRYNRKDQERISRVNVGGTRNIIAAARRAGVRVLVWTGSCTAVTDDMRYEYRRSFFLFLFLFFLFSLSLQKHIFGLKYT